MKRLSYILLLFMVLVAGCAQRERPEVAAVLHRAEHLLTADCRCRRCRQCRPPVGPLACAGQPHSSRGGALVHAAGAAGGYVLVALLARLPPLPAGGAVVCRVRHVRRTGTHLALLRPRLPGRRRLRAGHDRLCPGPGGG